MIEQERYFFLCSRYIDLNPVKAGMVNDPGEYSWSGYQTLAFGKAGIIALEFHSLYEGLGNTPEERCLGYRSIVQQPFIPDLNLENRKSCILGDPNFKAKMKELLEKI